MKVAYGLEEDATGGAQDDDPFESGSDSDIDSDIDDRVKIMLSSVNSHIIKSLL